MSVVFDLTVAGPEILDAVVFMDKSPAYAAFKEEIEKILSDFNKTGRFGDKEIDVKELVDSSSEAVINMHRAFLIWTFNEELNVKDSKDSQYTRFLKLFFKGQEKSLVAANGGKKSIDVAGIEELKAKYIEAISTTPDLFNSLKEFFAGYVYGYFFNYLTEQKVMRDYAEFLVCLGIMSNKISTSETQKQKILPKMALLLNNDRFKYISGEIPLGVMLDIVYDRFEFTGITDSESEIIRNALKNYIIANYEYRESEDLVTDKVVTNIMTSLNKSYISVDAFVGDLHKNSFDGIRTFLDCDKNDMCEYTVAKVNSVVDDKCTQNFDGYYTSEREPVLEFGLDSDCRGYKYPLTYKNSTGYWFADIYKVIIFPACDDGIYDETDEAELPLSEFPFAVPALKTNIIRFIGGLEEKGYSVRKDKKSVLEEIHKISSASNLTEDDKRMMSLEKILYVISGNMDAVSYQQLLHECVFGTKLYEDYIRYRMDCIFAKGMKSLEAKKNLLDELNKIK